MEKENSIEEQFPSKDDLREKRRASEIEIKNNKTDKNDAEIIRAQVEFELDALDSLIIKTGETNDTLIEEAGLTDEEKKELKIREKFFLKKTEKLKKLKNNKGKLEKLRKFKEEIWEETFLETEKQLNEIIEIADSSSRNKSIATENSDKEGDSKGNVSKGEIRFYAEDSKYDKKADIDKMHRIIKGEERDAEIIREKESLREFEDFKKEASFLLIKFKENLKNFKEIYPDKNNFHQKIEEAIAEYEFRIDKFKEIKKINYGDLAFVEINQLVNEMQKRADADWIELYKKKTGSIESDTKEGGEDNTLEDLDESEINGINNDIEKKENDIELGEEKLSEIEKIELEALIREKKGDIDVDKIELAEKFKNFIEKNKEEKKFNKKLFKQIHLLDDKVQEIKLNIPISQDFLNEMLDLDNEIIAFIGRDWETELKIFKGEVEFNEEESELVEKLKNKIGGVIEKLRNDFDWSEFPQGRIEQQLEIQAVIFLMENFTEKKWFVGQEELVAEFILRNKK